LLKVLNIKLVIQTTLIMGLGLGFSGGRGPAEAGGREAGPPKQQWYGKQRVEV